MVQTVTRLVLVRHKKREKKKKKLARGKSSRGGMGCHFRIFDHNDDGTVTTNKKLRRNTAIAFSRSIINHKSTKQSLTVKLGRAPFPLFYAFSRCCIRNLSIILQQCHTIHEYAFG